VIEKPPNVAERAMGALDTVIQQVGEIGVLFGQVVYTAVRYPKGYWADTRDDTYYVLKRVFFPAIAVLAGYGLLAASFAVAILLFLGAASRLGTVYLTFSVREIAPLFTGVVISGAIGAATTSELGARKIREELDALRVLGQDPVRLIVLPRVLACVLIMVVMNILGVVVTTGEALMVTHILGNVSYGAFMASFINDITVGEIIGNLVKTALIGLFIGVIAASKGLTVTRGAEGVGRAVNQSVVINLMMVFVVDNIFNLILLALNPNITVSR
jgi:phospholipid/cholesterol/gamma-HCH transport system permease protein